MLSFVFIVLVNLNDGPEGFRSSFSSRIDTGCYVGRRKYDVSVNTPISWRLSLSDSPQESINSEPHKSPNPGDSGHY